MKKLRTNKDVELMELKNGASIFIPKGEQLEILSNKDNRIIEFKYKGYIFKELIINEYNGLELIDEVEELRDILKNELLEINNYYDLKKCMSLNEFDLSEIREYGDKEEKEFVFESELWENISDYIKITFLTDDLKNSDDIKILDVIFK